MITAKEISWNKYHTCLELISHKVGKVATVWDWGHGWQLQYVNGQRKSFTEYHQILNYLVERGW